MYPVAVLAGGLGLRLREVTGEALPKVLVPVLGRPFIDHKLAGLAAAGVSDVVLLLGHEGDKVRAHVGDGGQFGLVVTYVDDGDSLRGTGGALLHALPLLPEIFWVTYGDTLLDVDLAGAETSFAASRCTALMTVLHNRDQWEPSNVRVEGTQVLAYGKDPTPSGAEHIDYGMLVFRRDAWADFSDHLVFDLHDVLAPLIAVSKVTAFEVAERFHDAGTVEALRETEQFLRGARR